MPRWKTKKNGKNPYVDADDLGSFDRPPFDHFEREFCDNCSVQNDNDEKEDRAVEIQK